MEEHKQSWLEKLSIMLHGGPQDRSQLIDLLRGAQEHEVLDAEALSMMEGLLQVADMHVEDIMVPRSQMIVLEKNQSLAELLPTVIDSHHSRFPVYNNELDNIEGVLFAKDLVAYLLNPTQVFDIRTLLRPALFIPESKRLNALLREFRSSKNHMAIVVDEYGHVSGLLTMEDVLEQIIGEIEDEHDMPEEDYVKKHAETHYTIKAIMPIEEFNEYFSVPLADEDCDTIGGLIIKHFGHVPKRHEKLNMGPYTFTVLNADNRRIKVVKVEVGDRPLSL